MSRLAHTMVGAALVSVGLAVQTSRAPNPHAALPAAIVADATSRHRVDTTFSHPLNEVIQTYCTRCHGERRQQGNLTLADFDVASPEQNGEIAEKMISKLRTAMMPPPGARRPSADTLLALVEALETRMDAVAYANPNPGRRTFQRLNRAEYARSIKTLLDITVDPDRFLPTETVSNNFDNISDVQTPSTTMLEGYLRAAGHISRIAIGDPVATPTSSTYKVAKTGSQVGRVPGAPYGTRGGISIVHNFVADGEYVFQLDMHPGPTGFLFGLTTPDEQIEISINGERVALIDIDRWMSESDPDGMRLESPLVPVRAGPQRVTAAFIQKFEGPADDLLTPVDHTLADTQIGSAYGVTTLPHLRDLAIVGPHGVTGVSDTPSRRRVFSCRPLSLEEEIPCATEIVTRLGTQAYRRPLAEHDVDGLMRFYREGAADGGFEAGIRTALQAMLASPHFIFRLEETPSKVSPGEVYAISDSELATRLSFFLWAAAPDAELIDVASDGKLSNEKVLEQQVRRMLADPRAEALSTRFFSQWLRLQDLEKLHPDAQLYPYYDNTLAQAMARETQLLFDHLVREDKSFLELLTADYTFVNERLAGHYEFAGVTGTDFRKVYYPDTMRRGLLGHGSVLTLTSHADRTSPVLRGKWVMEVLLGSPPPPPPPNVPDLEETEAAEDGRFTTTRERIEEHRSNPACRSCHRMMDPIGLALDNFDVTGKWRIKEQGVPLDTRGDFYDGTAISSPADLRTVLLSRPIPIVRNFTQNLMAYALGRRVEYYDMPTIRAISQNAMENDYRMSTFILGVVNSPAFRMAMAEATDDEEMEK